MVIVSGIKETKLKVMIITEKKKVASYYSQLDWLLNPKYS